MKFETKKVMLTRLRDLPDATLVAIFQKYGATPAETRAALGQLDYASLRCVSLAVVGG